MNNNQFKRFIREKIEQYTNENNLITVYIDTTSNSISNVQLIPTPSKMEYAIYNLGDNSIEASTIDIHKPEYKELKLDWGAVSDIVYDGIRFKKENSDNEADGIYALLAYDFESKTVFKIMSSSSVDYVFSMLLSDFLKSFDCKKDDEENTETIVDSDAINTVNSREDTDNLTDSVSSKLIKEEEHNHDNRNHIVGLVGKNKMIM